MASQRALFAALVAACSGYSVVRHGKRMMHEGVTVEEGGGWTAVLISEALVCFAAVGVALS
jgi:hypothetical protein